MDVPLIKDREHLEAWLSTSSHEECVAIAHRASMRVAPSNIRRTAFDDQLVNVGLATSAYFRPLLISGVSAASPSSAIRQAAVKFALYEANHNADAASAYSVDAAVDTQSFASHTFASVVHAFEFQPTAWTTVSRDVVAVQNGELLINLPLWIDETPQFASDWSLLRSHVAHLTAGWQFWVRWYEAALRGQPLNWKMQEEIAMIPAKVWEGDVAGLAAAIAIIEHKYRLLDQIADLKAKLNEAKAQDQIFDSTLPNRWHNNPPELLNTVAEVRDQFSSVLRAIDNAENELGRPNPDPSALRKNWQLFVGCC